MYGLPGVGLLLFRMAVAAALILRLVQLHNHALPPNMTPHLIAAVIGLVLLIGSWTAVAGVILAIIELVIAISHNGDPWVSVLLASLGVGLALVGAGSWSVDAKRFGWKRIEIRRPDK